jgi:secreted trypsin-like serine protease
VPHRRSRARAPRALAPLLAAVAVLLPLLGGAAGAQAAPRAHSAVVGGTPAVAGALPAAAFVTVQQTASSAIACTATVVAPAVVLTAAHCLVDDRSGAVAAPGSVTVATGRLDRTDESRGEAIPAVRVDVYPGYDRGELTGDLALIDLAASTSAPATAFAGAGGAGLAAAGARATIAGFGVPSALGGEPSTVLLQGTTTILGDAACRRLLGDGFDVDASLCAVDLSGWTVSACHGDSGGPLLVARPDGVPVVVGVTSWGSASCDSRVPQAFTRVSTYAGWIARELVAAPAPPPPASAPAAVDSDTPSAPVVRIVELPSTQPRASTTAAPAPRSPASLVPAGLYRGLTDQGRRVAVRVNPGGRVVAAVTASLRAACVGPHGRRAHRVARLAAALPRVALTSARRFTVARRATNRARATIHGAFAADLQLAGSIRVRWRTDAGTRCDSRAVRFHAD